MNTIYSHLDRDHSRRRRRHGWLRALTLLSTCWALTRGVFAQNPTTALVEIQLRGRTLRVPAYLLPRYLAAGATTNSTSTSAIVPPEGTSPTDAERTVFSRPFSPWALHPPAS